MPDQPSRAAAEVVIKRKVQRPPKRPDFQINLPCGKTIIVRRNTEDGHLADEVEGPDGMKIGRVVEVNLESQKGANQP